MKHFLSYILFAALCLFAFVPNANAQQTAKEIPTYHEFTVKFSQKVDAYQLQRHKNVSLKCGQSTIAFDITQETPKKVKIISQNPLPENSTCTLQVDPFTKSIAGKTLSQFYSQTFTVKDKPKTALHSNDKLVKQLKASYKVNESNNLVVYGAKGTTKQELQDLQDAYASVMRDLLPYFPEIATSKYKPVIVMVKTAEDEVNYRKIGGVVMDGGSAWITNDNIIGVRSAATPSLKHEYIHWMISNIYGVSLPLWADEAVTSIFTNLYRELEPTETLLAIFREYPYYISTQYNEKNLYRAHTMESNAVIIQMLLEKGLTSFHKMLLDAKNTSLDAAWKKHYGVTPRNSEVYIKNMKQDYIDMQKANGLDLAGLQAFNKKSKLLPIWDNAAEYDLYLYKKFDMIETKLLRIYVAPGLKDEKIQQLVDFGNSLNPKNYKYRMIIAVGTDSVPGILPTHLSTTGYANSGFYRISATSITSSKYTLDYALSTIQKDLDRIHERFK